MSKEIKKLKQELFNRNILASAMIWHLNNVDEKGEPTTKMNIPNAVHIAWFKKVAQLPKDRTVIETEALKIVRKR